MQHSVLVGVRSNSTPRRWSSCSRKMFRNIVSKRFDFSGTLREPLVLHSELLLQLLDGQRLLVAPNTCLKILRRLPAAGAVVGDNLEFALQLPDPVLFRFEIYA